MAKYSRYNVEEERCVQRALERSKEILNHVNAAVKQAEDQHRLAEIQKRLDKSLFDKIDHPVTNEFKVSAYIDHCRIVVVKFSTFRGCFITNFKIYIIFRS